MRDLGDMKTICAEAGLGARDAPHLEAIPGVGTVTGRRLTGGDVQHLGGHADRALHLQVLLLGAADEVSGHCTVKVASQPRGFAPLRMGLHAAILTYTRP